MYEEAPRSRSRLAGFALLACAGLFLLPCCGRPPQVGHDNRELIVSLATAVSARNNEWLEANAKLVESRRAAKQLDDAEYAAFAEIVAKARGGDWKNAEERVYELREAQQPTAEDRQNVAEHRLSPDIGKPRPGSAKAKLSPGRGPG